MSGWNQHYDRLRYHQVYFDTAGPSRSAMAANARPALSVPFRPGQQAQGRMSGRQYLICLLDEALLQEEAASAAVERELQKYTRLQVDFESKKDTLAARIESVRALLENTSTAFMTDMFRSVENVQQKLVRYQCRYDEHVAGHRRPRAVLDHAEVEQQRAMGLIESLRQRLQEERPGDGDPQPKEGVSQPEEGEPQCILDNVEEPSEDESFSVDWTTNFVFDNDEGM
ncbi:hypothetical protein BDV97DRAFT_369853 [Delphinella strobiligena]|nr:hypothetical protein BDV97DRAFT_369853 [Delphinella strobiligena]